MARDSGRAAPGNELSGRFGLPSRQADGDWLDWAEGADELPPLRTTVTVERPRKAMTRNESPDIPFDRSFNAYRGCEHGCIYCFARPTHAWHDLSPGLDFETKLFAKPTGPALLRAEFARAGYRPAVLAMGTNTDPYQPIEREWRITRAVLDLCLETRHPVSVTTKSDRVLMDLDRLAALAGLQLAMAMVSVTTLERKLARSMEPRAAAPHRRLEAIRRLSAAGVPTFVSVSPIIPALTDHELEAILAAAAEAGAWGAFCQPVRLPLEVAPLFERWLHLHAPDRAARVLGAIRAMRGGKLNRAGWFERMQPQGEWGRLLRMRLRMATRRLGLDRPPPELRLDLFAPPHAISPSADRRQRELF
ncbi:PA0069 family radical SAM protein [Sandaracinobacter sp. RS1-74]|uniref:PA0069 family radical SAM protein n=1 Tax=Sandaracinobacteroides sayramensis TaxID=2913411 RepID=UPI001EDC02E1|nr:PA0069 family radical SAM protein [Sandaracinobacteroides sayramensis]MCG2842225.1 PA0069 family radical SAM protein [Sandaracinobacteroides sayramensis]